eukprot:GHRR01008838.1.p4 GENE.GHRR01008838.1~~GHRR01008838.1.p4  ORF type:complete len:117 (+),score=35.62 GHRR01008838.1:1926-2276(+)
MSDSRYNQWIYQRCCNGSAGIQPVPADVDETLHKWMDRTPPMAAIKGAAAATAPGTADKDKKEGNDKKAAPGKKKSDQWCILRWCSWCSSSWPCDCRGQQHNLAANQCAPAAAGYA